MATPSYQAVEAVRVFAWGTEIGAVTRDPKQRAFVFQYTDRWSKRGVELSPLHMPLAREPYTFPLLAQDADAGNTALEDFFACHDVHRRVGTKACHARQRL